MMTQGRFDIAACHLGIVVELTEPRSKERYTAPPHLKVPALLASTKLYLGTPVFDNYHHRVLMDFQDRPGYSHSVTQ
jgi:hypothetical protein